MTLYHKLAVALLCATTCIAAAYPASPGKSKRKRPVTATARPLNPIVPPGLFIADPEPRLMPDGRLYVYGSLDEPEQTWCSPRYNVLWTQDLVHWNVEQYSFATQGEGKQADYTERVLYAPDCIHHNGKYYLYYCLAGELADDEGVAVSDSPYGPFRDGRIIKGAEGIDPSVFIDDDGQGYLFWGQWSAKGAKLSKDMLSLEGEIHDGLVTYDKHYFNEGSSVRKRNGIYYLIYGSHSSHGESNCATLDYATATSPFGPYTYRGVIVDNFNSAGYVVNNHGSIVEIDGRWYIFYHRPTHNTSSMRKVCAEPIRFRPDGTIEQVEMTTQGIGGPIDPTLKMDAARACQLSGHVRVVVRRPKHDIPVEYLSEIRDGDTAHWRYYRFGKPAVSRFVCKTYGAGKGGNIEIHADSAEGPLMGTCRIAPQNGEVAYAIHETEVKPVSGKHAVVMVFKADNGAGKEDNLMNLEWFQFE